MQSLFNWKNWLLSVIEQKQWPNDSRLALLSAMLRRRRNRSGVLTAQVNGHLRPELMRLVIVIRQPRTQARAQPRTHVGQLSAGGIGTV